MYVCFFVDLYVCVCLCAVCDHLAQFGCLPARLPANCLRVCLLLCRAVVHRVCAVCQFCIGVLWFGFVCVGCSIVFVLSARVVVCVCVCACSFVEMFVCFFGVLNLFFV